MNFPRVIINNTPPELFQIAMMAVQSFLTYEYEGRKSYTFYYYGKYKAKVVKNSSGYSVKVTKID